MFLQHFDMPEQPFGVTPDPRFLFHTESHREALASLYTGFYGNRGFTLLIAEPGMGKTTLLFEFVSQIRDRAKTVFLFNTLCEANDILSLILQDLGVVPGTSLAEKHRQLNGVLVAEARRGRPLVLIIDEAQNLSVDALEAVRLLTNFETAQSKLMQVIFAGQPQLAEKLARPEIAQLLQRVSTMCRLIPLTAAQTVAYIEHRVKVAGYTGKPLFTPAALNLIADAGRGIPRVINTLCFNSLCLCRARNSRVVDEFTIEEVIGDLQLPMPLPMAVTAKTEKSISVVAPSAQFSEVRVSSSKTARYITAALLVACLGLFVVFWPGGSWTRTHLPFSMAAVFSQIRHVASKRTTTAEPAPTLAHASVEPVETATDTVAASNPAALSTVIDANEAPVSKTITVARGETLEEIARQNLSDYNSTVLQQIQALNPRLNDPNHIEIGRTIRLPGRPGVSTREKP